MSTTSTGTHYQGERSRRTARSVSVIWIAVLLFHSLTAPESAVVWLITVATGVVLFVLCDFGFARRMGIVVAPDALTLVGAIRRSRIPWERVDHFEWRVLRRPANEWLWAVLEDGRAVRLPTVQRATGRNAISIWEGSNRLRTRDGATVDALELLNGALAASRHTAAR
jgi:hypothetical protein